MAVCNDSMRYQSPRWNLQPDEMETRSIGTDLGGGPEARYNRCKALLGRFGCVGKLSLGVA